MDLSIPTKGTLFATVEQFLLGGMQSRSPINSNKLVANKLVKRNFIRDSTLNYYFLFPEQFLSLKYPPFSTCVFVEVQPFEYLQFVVVTFPIPAICSTFVVQLFLGGMQCNSPTNANRPNANKLVDKNFII